MALSEPEKVYEQLLVVTAQAGDARALDRLAARWRPRLVRTAARILGGKDGAEDAAQEALAAIAWGLHGLSDPSRFPAWAFGILHRKCFDRVRRGRRQGMHDQPPLEPVALPATDEALDIERALTRLTHEHRVAALLHFAEGLTHFEVADATGVPVGTAKSRIFHARRQLKAALNGDEP